MNRRFNLWLDRLGPSKRLLIFFLAVFLPSLGLVWLGVLGSIVPPLIGLVIVSGLLASRIAYLRS